MLLSDIHLGLHTLVAVHIFIQTVINLHMLILKWRPCFSGLSLVDLGMLPFQTDYLMMCMWHAIFFFVVPLNNLATYLVALMFVMLAGNHAMVCGDLTFAISAL